MKLILPLEVYTYIYQDYAYIPGHNPFNREILMNLYEQEYIVEVVHDIHNYTVGTCVKFITLQLQHNLPLQSFLSYIFKSVIVPYHLMIYICMYV